MMSQDCINVVQQRWAKNELAAKPTLSQRYCVICVVFHIYF